MLQGESLQLGGWHREVTDSLPAVPRGQKRASDAPDTSQESAKRSRGAPADEATEPESDDQRPDSQEPSAPGTRAPPPSLAALSRESTATTVLDTSAAFAQSRSFGDSSHWGRPAPSPPKLLSPLRGPVHARLRTKVLANYLESAERDAQAAEAAEAAKIAKAAKAKAARVRKAANAKARAAAAAAAAAEAEAEAAAAEAEAEADQAEADQAEAAAAAEADEADEAAVNAALENAQAARWADELMVTDPEAPAADLDDSNAPALEPTPPRVASSGPFASSTAPQRTYARTRTHAPSQPVPNATTSAETNDNVLPPPRPNSPSLTTGDLLRRERQRVLLAKVRAEAINGAPRRPRLFAEATRAPATRPQARQPPSRNAPGVLTRGTRQFDPTSAARDDLIRFNEACAQDQATSFVQSATQQSQRNARRAPPRPRPLDELLPDDEELLAQAEAFAKNTWPVSSLLISIFVF